MLELSITITGMTQEDLITSLDEARAKLQEGFVSFRERGEHGDSYDLHITGDPEISPERFSESMLELDEIVSCSPEYEKGRTRLVYVSPENYFSLVNNEHDSFFDVDCELSIDTEVIINKANAVICDSHNELNNKELNLSDKSLFSDTDYEEDFHELFDTYLLSALNEHIKENADFISFTKEHPVSAKCYAMKNDWI